MTYTITPARDGEKCHDCGEPATVTLVADSSNDGNTDEVSFCEVCAEKRRIS
jgi:protein-arginine kinase activator protein McsA